MKRDLNDAEIRQLLQVQTRGHLGCCRDASEVHVLPVTYVYENRAIYCFSFEGEKLAIMRENPRVCLQVEDLMSPASWQSVVLWGTFHELSGDERQHALDLILERLWTAAAHQQTMYIPFRNSSETVRRALQDEGAILWSIAIDRMTGRMEQYE